MSAAFLSLWEASSPVFTVGLVDLHLGTSGRLYSTKLASFREQKLLGALFGGGYELLWWRQTSPASSNTGWAAHRDSKLPGRGTLVLWFICLSVAAARGWRHEEICEEMHFRNERRNRRVVWQRTCGGTAGAVFLEAGHPSWGTSIPEWLQTMEEAQSKGNKLRSSRCKPLLT